LEKILIASLRASEGKTDIIIGMAKALKVDFGYIKPFGERVLYRKKRLLDYDSALVTNIFDLQENPEDMSLGFDHSKLRFMYTKETIKDKLREMEENIGSDKKILFIEGGKDLTYGASVNLDPISLAKYSDAKLILVISGDDDSILDQLFFVKKYIEIREIELFGVIINKVQDIEDFHQSKMDQLQELGIRILGILPYERDLTYLSVDYVAETLFGKVLAGEKGLQKQVKNIFVGAMSADAAIRNPLFSKEGKLMITSGDRTDMIIGALESDTAAVVLTNNVLPPSQVITMADEKGIPMILVSTDTFRTAKQIDDMDRLITRNETRKIEILERMISENIDLDALMS